MFCCDETAQEASGRNKIAHLHQRPLVTQFPTDMNLQCPGVGGRGRSPLLLNWGPGSRVFRLLINLLLLLQTFRNIGDFTKPWKTCHIVPWLSQTIKKKLIDLFKVQFRNNHYVLPKCHINCRNPWKSSPACWPALAAFAGRVSARNCWSSRLFGRTSPDTSVSGLGCRKKCTPWSHGCQNKAGLSG